MTDQEFREQYKPLHVPASFEEAGNETDKIVFALADIGNGTAKDITLHFEKLHSTANLKMPVINIPEALTELYNKGLITAQELNGSLVYNLHKITEANEGGVNPELLAPGLD